MNRSRPPLPTARRTEMPFSPSSLNSPAFMSTLPLPRTSSENAVYTRRSAQNPRQTSSRSQRSKKTRSEGSLSSRSTSPDDSLNGKEEKQAEHQTKQPRAFNLEDYSIDLGKLGSSFRDGRYGGGQESEVVIPKQEIPHVPSEDGGPEDFTLNMEKWMRGTEKWRRKNEEQETMDEEEQDDEDAKEAEPHVEQPSQPEPVTTSGKAGNDDPEPEESNPTEKLTRSTTPPLPDLGTSEEAQLDRTTEAVFAQISALQEDVERHRREAADHFAEKQELEKECERLDMENEDLAFDLQTAGKRIAEFEERARQLEDEKEKKAQASARESGGKFDLLRAKFEPLSQELENARRDADVAKVAADLKMAELREQLRTSSETSAVETADLQEQLRNAEGKLQSNTENAEERLREVQATHEAEVASLKIKIQTSQLETSSTIKDNAALRSELSQLQKDLREEEEAAVNREDELTSQVESLTTQLEDLQSKSQQLQALETSIRALQNELEHSQSQLRETRRILDIVEDENERLLQKEQTRSEEREDLQQEVDTLKKDLRSRQDTIEAQSRHIEELQAENQGLRIDKTLAEPTIPLPALMIEDDQDGVAGDDDADEDDNIEPADEKTTCGAATSTVPITQTTEAIQASGSMTQVPEVNSDSHTTLEKMQAAHDTEVKRLKTVLLKAAEGMKRRESRLSKAHSAELSSLRSQLDEAREKSKKSERSATLSRSLNDCERENAQLKTKVSELETLESQNDATIEQLQREVAEARTELQVSEAAKGEMQATNEEVNRVLEKRWRRVIEEREKEWRRRIKVLFKEREGILQERDVMGRVLMWGWGKEEVGFLRLDTTGKVNEGKEKVVRVSEREVQGVDGKDGSKIKREGKSVGVAAMGYKYKFVMR
ncbi:hypothetical protein MMC25_004091 [Agyrium rufum]|nr:hypothetical protein [Agyrium rufum]